MCSSLVRIAWLHLGSRLRHRATDRRRLCPKGVVAMDLLDQFAYHWRGFHVNPVLPEAG